MELLPVGVRARGTLHGFEASEVLRRFGQRELQRWKGPKAQLYKISHDPRPATCDSRPRDISKGHPTQ